MNTLTKRVLSALILAPAVIGAVYWGGAVYAGLLVAAGILMAVELARMIAQKGWRAQWAALAGAVLSVVVLFPAGGFFWGLLGVSLSWAASVAIARRFGHFSRWALLAVPYVAAPLLGLLVLRQSDPHGAAAVFWVLGVVWATDIAAYFTGRAIGGPKLSVRHSPNKTWAGLGGGALAAAGVGLAGAFLIGNTSPAVLAGLGAVSAVVAQAGDVGESAMKRFFKVKDSGRLIPGHGGILDRVDGLAAVSIAATLLGVLRTGAQSGAASGLLIW